MKHILFVLCFMLFLPQIAFAEDGKRDITGFLQTNYGIVYEPSFSQKLSWDCPDKRMIRPSGTVTHNWVCRRRDPSLSRLIVWRLNNKLASTVEKENFDGMAGGKDKERGEAQCKATTYKINNDRIEGIINDCTLQLPNGEFYISFYHFNYRDLGFTFLVKNASPTGSTPKVAEDLREWLSELKFND